jgi:hypothetical protein
VPPCSASRRFRSAPASTSIFTIRKSPSNAALCSAVQRRSRFQPAFGSAPCASS